MNLLDKIMLEFEVHQEPVQSKLLQAVSSSIKEIWDLDPRMQKYKNKNLVDVDNKYSVEGEFRKLAVEANALKDQLHRAGRAKSKDAEDLKKESVKDKTASVIYTLGQLEKNKAIEVINKIIISAMQIQANKQYKTDREKIKALTRWIRTDIMPQYHLDEHNISAVLLELGDPDSNFTNFLENALEKGAEGIAADVNKQTKTA
jgi:ATP-dependent Clp protease ATP-binding subunit ClpA